MPGSRRSWAGRAACAAGWPPRRATLSSSIAGGERGRASTWGSRGVFSFAGHTHEVVAARSQGEVEADPADLGRVHGER